MTAAIFLIGATLFGIALVRRVFGVWTNHAEQALWGLIIGWMLSTVATYGLARVMGRLSLSVALTVLIATWLAAIFLWLPTIRTLRSSRSLPRLWRKDYAHLLTLLCFFAPLYFALFQTHMLQPGADGGLYSGGKSALYDMAFHAAISNSFIYGANFPPIYTPLPPAPLLYPLLPDFQTALLVTLGLDLHTALVSTAVPLALALTGIFYLFALRLLAFWTAALDARARFAAALATVLFLFNGGLGFRYFFRDWRGSGKSFVDFCSALEVNYANLAEKGILWTNIIADGLLPQRPSLFGIPLTLTIFTLFALFWRESGAPTPKSNSWRLLLGAGLLAGLLPAFHAHSYAAVGLVSGILFVMRPRRAWLAFWLPAVLFALPELARLASHVAASGFAHFQLGWRGHNEPSWLLFWLRNIGLPTLLIIPAWIYAPRALRLFYLAFLALLIFSLLLIFSPNDYDNLKLMYYWYAATCVLVAGWLVSLASRRRWLVPVVAAIFVSIASGILALVYEWQSKNLMFSYDEVAAATFVREKTAPRSLFLTAPSIHQPILSLAGRAIVRGATSWLWSHGYPFAEREADVRAIYSGRDDAMELLRYYGVDYIFLGPRERQDLKANHDFLDRTFPHVYRGGDITIYDARDDASKAAAADRPKWLEGYPPREYAARVDRDPFQPLVGFTDIGYPLYRYHKVLYGRPPRYDEFMADLREIGRGVYPGTPNWRDVLETNRRKLTGAWSERADFKEQFFAGDYNEAYVRLHYFGYLRRDPQDDFWLRNLERTRDYRSLTRAFLESDEYKEKRP